MKTYTSKEIKNIALLGSKGSGKTTLAEAMLYECGVIKRRGTVLAKNTVSDYLPCLYLSLVYISLVYISLVYISPVYISLVFISPLFLYLPRTLGLSLLFILSLIHAPQAMPPHQARSFS